MVEKPIRIAKLVAHWFENDRCSIAIVNLKLPMKRRWLEILKCLELLQESVGNTLKIKAKHLYHDREEITLFCQK